MRRIASLPSPLYNYLLPLFGNIFGSNWDGDVLGAHFWTDELRRAVKQYLVHEVSDAHYQYVQTELVRADVLSEARETQVDELIRKYEPWEIAETVREAVIVEQPALFRVIGGWKQWPHPGDASDAVVWLRRHASSRRMEALLAECPDRQPEDGLFRLMSDGTLYTTGRLLGAHFTPAELLARWGTVHTDLTADEWRLIKPYCKPNRLRAFHRRLDAMLYRFETDVTWRELPAKFGEPVNIYACWRNYRDHGLFDRILADIKGEPDADRLVRWLEHDLASRRGGDRPPGG